jgi:transcriptional regulator with XRE-family HTH domain
MELKDRLIELRVGRNLPKPRLAEAIGVTVQEITDWENGSAVPTREQRKALEQYYRQPLPSGPDEEETPEEKKKGPNLKVVWIATLIWAAAIAGLVVIFFIQEFGG